MPVAAEDSGNRPISATANGRSVLLTVCPFILGTELGERLGYYGIAMNFVNYIKRLGTSSSTAATAAASFAGFVYLTPLFGGWLADAHLGRYRTILLSVVLSTIGMFLLTIGSMTSGDGGHTHANRSQWLFFSLALVFVGFGNGGIKPNVSAFGADQFDDNNGEQSKEKASFFNWFYLFINIGALLASTVIVYIQDQGMWTMSFIITAIVMILTGCIFRLGKRYYKLIPASDSPFSRFARITSTALMNRRTQTTYHSLSSARETHYPSIHDRHWLDNAIGTFNREEVEDVKLVFRVTPLLGVAILHSMLVMPIPALMILMSNQTDRHVTVFGRQTNVPSASMASTNIITLLLLIPIYDRILLPLMEKRMRYRPTSLQRIGVGLFFTVIALFSGFVLEHTRLELYSRGSVHTEMQDGKEVEIVEMSIWWTSIVHILDAFSEVAAGIGWLEFFYSQAPDSMRSMMSAVNLFRIGISSYLSGLLLYLIDQISSLCDAQWLSNNLNEGHLDLLFLTFAGVGVVMLFLFAYVSVRYEYKEVVGDSISSEIPLTSIEAEQASKDEL